MVRIQPKMSWGPGTTAGDVRVTRDLTVDDDIAVGDDVTVTDDLIVPDLYGATATGGTLTIHANQTDTYPNEVFTGNAGYEIQIANGSDFIIDEAGTNFFTINRTGTVFSSDATSGDAFTINANSVNTGHGFVVNATAVTEGAGMAIYCDSDTINVGHPFEIYLGSSANYLTWAVDKDGDVWNETYQVASAGTTTRNSPEWRFNGKYWTGAASQRVAVVMRNNTYAVTQPYSQLQIVGPTMGSCFIRPHSTETKIFGGDSTTQDLQLFANTADATDMILRGAADFELFTGTSYGGGEHKQIFTAQTTNATQTTNGTLTLSDNTAVYVEATVIAMQSDGSDRNLYHLEGLFYRDGGGATQQGATTSITTIESEASCDCIFDVSSNSVRIRVTGVAAETWDWKTVLKWTVVS